MKNYKKKETRKNKVFPFKIKIKIMVWGGGRRERPERDQMTEFALRNEAEIIQTVRIGFTYYSICQRLHLFSKESLYLTRYELLSACVDVILVRYNNLKKEKKKTNNKQNYPQKG